MEGKTGDRELAEFSRWARGLGWEVRRGKVFTPHGVLPLPGSRLVASLDPEREPGALAALCLLKLLQPGLRVDLEGSMFALVGACRFLQRAGFPVDPWFVTGRELYAASSRALGDRKAYLVEARPEEVAGSRVEGFPWLRVLEPHRGPLPQKAEPVGSFPQNRVWRLIPEEAR